MNTLLPDQLKALWQAVLEGRLTASEFETQREQLTEEWKAIWRQAILLEGHHDLTESLLSELGIYFNCSDLADIERRCQKGALTLKAEWLSKFRSGDSRTVEHFYDQSEAYIYDLAWWHTLIEDNSPLAYVFALRFAQDQGCRQHLDFGSGISAGSMLFLRHGFASTSADISSRLLAFSRWRLHTRGYTAQLIDLKTEHVPHSAYDIITAMDVFEHLVDPVTAVEQLWSALRPGGFLFGRFHGDIDPERPQHIVSDFRPTFARIRELGFVEVWKDEWLWGHQVFRKP